MGQKVNAFGYRLQIFPEYKSIWFENNLNTYSTLMRHDISISTYIYNILKKQNIICTNIQKICYNNTLYLFVHYCNTKKTKVPLSYNINQLDKNINYYINYLTQRIYIKYKVNCIILLKELDQDHFSSNYISELLKFEYENKKMINLKEAVKSIVVNTDALEKENKNIFYLKNNSNKIKLDQLYTQLCNLNTVQETRHIEKMPAFDISYIRNYINILQNTCNIQLPHAAVPRYKKIIGIKVETSGRINGAEMAKKDKLIIGSIPFQELKTKIEYSCAAAITMYGLIGIKVWIARSN